MYNNDIHYSSDLRLGSYCTINDKDVYNLFNADLKSIESVAGKVTTNYSKKIGMSSFNLNSYDIATGSIKITFYVGGILKEDMYINTSNLISECKECTIKTSEDNFEYIAVMTDFNVKETGVDFYNEVEITLSAIKRLQMVEVESNTGVLNFKNVGNVESGAKYIITPNADIESFMINKITIKNLISGLPFIIDGINGEIRCNGVNRFLDTDLVNFPKVKQGDNKITFSGNANVKVCYYPTFII